MDISGEMFISIVSSFFSSVSDIFRGKFKEGLEEKPFKKLSWLMIIGTIPAGLVGILFEKQFEALFNSCNICWILPNYNRFIVVGC